MGNSEFYFFDRVLQLPETSKGSPIKSQLNYHSFRIIVVSVYLYLSVQYPPVLQTLQAFKDENEINLKQNAKKEKAFERKRTNF